MLKLFYSLFLVSIFSCQITKQGDSVVTSRPESFGNLSEDFLICFKNLANSTRVINLQVLPDHILRAIAHTFTTFSERNDLMEAGRKDSSVKREVEEGSTSLTLRTNQLITSLSLFTAKASFSDLVGKSILKDAKGFETIHTSATIDGLKACQTLESRINDAFYSSFQRQIDGINYKGKGVNLTQYNSLGAIPFLLSSKNYGILWDTCSNTCVIDVCSYNSLSTRTLYSSEENPEGLAVTYIFNTINGKYFVKQGREIILTNSWLS